MNIIDEYKKRSYIESSKKFLRLGETTQVVFPKNGRAETVKTRFSHSYEVMNSAIMISRSLNCGIEVDYQHALGNVCLLHDIGHPAFGHEGAKILNNRTKELGLKEGFDDNNNNFVIIEKEQIPLEPYDLASLIKYPNKLYEGQKKKYLKMLDDSIDEDIRHFEKKIKIFTRPKRTVACEIMDEADRNSYVCSDLTDCYSLGWGTSIELKHILDSKQFSSYDIKTFLSSAIYAIDNKDKSLIKRIFNDLKILLNQNFILGENLQLEHKNEELFLLREALYSIEGKIFINSKEVVDQRNIHMIYFNNYVDYVIKEKFYPSRTYKNLIESSHGEQQLKYIRDMIGETTDWYIQNFNNKKEKN
jgi:dGTP triphosphohydrolase